MLGQQLREEFDIFPLVGLEEQFKEIYSSIKDTFTKAQGSSILLQGPPGSGKSTLVKVVLDHLRKVQGNVQFYNVVLSGLVHTDDKLALQSMIYQLKVAQEGDESNETFGARSFADKLRFVLQALQAGTSQSTPIVIVLEEFELFTAHTNQILLYNLFDVAQSCQTPISVICITSRHNVVTLLEKRVRSRFTHRIVEVLPGSLDDFFMIAKQSFSLPRNTNTDKDTEAEYNEKLQQFFNDPQIISEIKSVFDNFRSAPLLLQICQQTQTELSATRPFFNQQVLKQSFIQSARELYIDRRARVINELGLLELCMMVSIKKVVKRLVDMTTPSPVFNFEIIFDEYHKFTSQVSRMGNSSLSQINFKKAIALRGFEELAEYNLIQFEQSANMPKEYKMARCTMTLDQLTSALKPELTKIPSVAKWIQTD